LRHQVTITAPSHTGTKGVAGSRPVGSLNLRRTSRPIGLKLMLINRIAIRSRPIGFADRRCTTAEYEKRYRGQYTHLPQLPGCTKILAGFKADVTGTSLFRSIFVQRQSWAPAVSTSAPSTTAWIRAGCCQTLNGSS